LSNVADIERERGREKRLFSMKMNDDEEKKL